MTPAEVTAILRQFNEWRRGDEDIPQFDPRKLGEAIDAAIEMIDRLEAAEKINREWLRANAPGGWIDNLRIENDALRAEVIHIKEVEFPRKAQAVADGWRGKCERLEAKIAEMEKQRPAAWLDDGTCRAGSDSTALRVVTEATKKDMPASVAASFSVPLYALHGAQGEEK